MSNLPQETIDLIGRQSDEAQSKAGARSGHMEYGNMLHYLQGVWDGHNAGATEWAGKAQELADTLKWIQINAPIEPVVDDAISAALAKYKEVTNGNSI